ncbi:MAG: glycosyltransferase family 39 protein [Owenweeksia sp.]|nr:glycosyltransferase family 39 protein [Owenweeksia sp.]
MSHNTGVINIMKQKESTSLYLIAIAVFLIIAAPALWTDGLFMDGLFYAAISKNMAHDLGSFWQPHLSWSRFPQFYEHPPLALGLQSIWFQILGDSLYTERLYSLFSNAAVGALMVGIWKNIAKSYRYAWLPLLLWALVPVVSWACANNMLENTMAVFITLSAWLYLKAASKSGYWWIAASGVALALALLSKGFVCLYLWSMPFFAWLVFRNETFGRMVLKTLLMVSSTLLPVFLLFIFSAPAAVNMTEYFNNQVVGSIQNVATVDSRLAIIWMFGQHILLPLALVLLVLLISKFYLKNRSTYEPGAYGRWALFFNLVMWAGILPIMVSMKQRGFYLVTVYPFLALSLGLLLLPLLERIKSLGRTGLLWLRVSAVLLTVLAVVFSFLQLGKVGRDKAMLHDCYAIIEEVGEDQKIGLQKTLHGNYSLHGYLARYAHISLMMDEGKYRYFLARQGRDAPPGYQIVEMDLQVYQLFRKKIANRP